MSSPSAPTLTATNPEVSSTGSAPVRKKKHVDIKQGLPKPWQKERSQRDTDILHASRELWKAKAKLEKTRESVDEITLKVGYENANSFRKLFRKNTGLSPKEYRMQFSRLNDTGRA